MAVYFGIWGIFFFPCNFLLSHYLYCWIFFSAVLFLSHFVHFYKTGLKSFLMWLLQPHSQNRLARQNLTYQNVSVLHLAAIAELPSLLQRYPLVFPQAAVCFCLFWRGFRRGGRVATLVPISSFSPLPCPDMIGRLTVCFFVKSLVVQHLLYAERNKKHHFLFQI